MCVCFPPFSLLAWNFVALKLETLDNRPDIFPGSGARSLDVSPAPCWTSAVVASLWRLPHLSGGLKAEPAVGRLEGPMVSVCTVLAHPVSGPWGLTCTTASEDLTLGYSRTQ